MGPVGCGQDVGMERDPLIVWARQDDKPGVRVFRAPDAVAVAVPDLSRRDRLVLAGEPAAAAKLLAEVLPEAGPSFRPLGDEDLIAEVAQRVGTIEMVGHFVMMDVCEPVPGPERGAWLHDTTGVAEFLREAFPDSFARPGGSGVRRWAGVRGGNGELLATAADAWSVPELGFIAGVATHPAARGAGLATALCAFVTNDMLRTHPRVALFADHWNEAALRTYRRLGFAERSLGVARQVTAAPRPVAR
jgi:ribosomal protein S18 acetylase RimI-like enzyme